MIRFIKNLESGKLFIAGLVLLLFLPRVVKKGMFGDGLLYASIARNMSEGRGSFWSPYFSSSYWLENIPTTYFENPPLMLWLESLLFTLLGDQWWIEKLFCLLVLLLNIFLFRFLWFTIFEKGHPYRPYWYITVAWWYMIPVVVWANVNNLMDNLLLSFCMAATIFLIRGIKKNHFSYFDFALGCLFIFGGILTKGPVALYPLAIPLLYWIVVPKIGFQHMIFISVSLILCTLCLLLSLLVTIPEAKYFFTEYWNQRLKAVIVGSRSDMALSGWDRLYIIQQLLLELIPSGILLVILHFYAKAKNIFTSPPNEQGYVRLFVLSGLSASLPILLSTKQSGIYLLPGLPMFSIAFAILTIPIIKSIFSVPYFTIHIIKINTFLCTAILVGVCLSLYNFGKLGREAALIKDIEKIKKFIPLSSKVGVCNEMMGNFVIHTYMQRMGKYELCNDYTLPTYIVQDSQCANSLAYDLNTNFTVVSYLGLQYFTLLQKKQ